MYKSFGGVLSITNTIIWGNTEPVVILGAASITFSSVQLSTGTTTRRLAEDASVTLWTYKDNIDADPLFVDAVGGDYRLSDFSPCIGAGTRDGTPLTDIEGLQRGNPPDIGVYENPLNAPLPHLESEMSMPAAAVTSIPSRPVAQRMEHAGERWGLFIGIEDYQDSRVTDLRYSVDDVHRITQILRAPQRGAFQHLKVLTSGRTNSQDTPTRLNMLRALNSWLSQAKPEDTVLFFFSGHGATDDKNRNYLLPVDVQAHLLEDTAIPMRRINEILNDRDHIAAKKVIVVLDSCHSGAKVGQKAFSVEGKILDPLFTETEGRITFASCGRDEIAYEEETLGHGVFSYYLADGLQGAGIETAMDISKPMNCSPTSLIASATGQSSTAISKRLASRTTSPARYSSATIREIWRRANATLLKLNSTRIDRNCDRF